ncbi:Terminase-like domain protein [Acetobacter conturbans]|uniref:Terminase-like domain protein n=1 Tax=Acetobacter conturbans TaxID=1737472 RepID=A0ABX0JZU1_9PROT|nr:Terminase-like domain protein [Acetobacter conturbans]NHN88871.1 Terminase-like domain protein [Acetobacter conturbans]
MPIKQRDALTQPQMEIYNQGWQSHARFRVAVCGRRFGKTFEAIEEVRRSIKMAVMNNVSSDNEIWYAAPTYKQAKKIFWPKLKAAIPEKWLCHSPRETDLSLTVGPNRHIVRVVGLENYDSLRGSGLFFF